MAILSLENVHITIAFVLKPTEFKNATIFQVVSRQIMLILLYEKPILNKWLVIVYYYGYLRSFKFWVHHDSGCCTFISKLMTERRITIFWIINYQFSRFKFIFLKRELLLTLENVSNWKIRIEWYKKKVIQKQFLW